MKFTKIALAVAALAAAQNAAAFEVYMSGASALRDVMPLVVDKVCQSSGRALYEAGPAISGSKSGTVVIQDKDRRVFTCTLHDSSSNSTVAADLGSIAGQALTLYWSDEIGDSANGTSGTYDKLLGGSITGIATLAPFTAPATQQATVNFVDPTQNCTANGTDTTFGTANGTNIASDSTSGSVKGYGFVGASKFLCSSQIAGHASEIGVSDVEPALFTAAYNNVPTDVGTSTVPAEWKNFDITALTNPANFKAAFVGSFGVAVQDNVTGVNNLSQDQLAQILAGTITNWQAVGGPNLAIKVCTRAPGSGTKATFNQLVSRRGCRTNTLADGSAGFQYAVRAATTVSTAGFRSFTGSGGFGVRELATTGDVQTCMTDGKNAAGTATATNGAIGIIGLDAAATVSTTAGYHFTAYNGVNPVDLTKATDTVDGSVDAIREDLIALGQYPLWVQSTVQKSPTLSDANKLAFYDYMSAHSGDPEYTTKFPGVLTLNDGRSGAPVGTAHTLTAGNLFYSRNTSGVSDTCGAAGYQ